MDTNRDADINRSGFRGRGEIPKVDALGRRSWSLYQRQRIVAEALAPQASVAEVARRHGLNANLIFKWLKRVKEGLPRDPDDLRRVAGDLQRDVATLSAEIYAKTLLIEKLKMQLAVLRRARFGRSSERLDQAVEQLELLIGDIEESEAESEARAETAEKNETFAPPSPKRNRQPSGRAPLPDHLPQEVVTHEPDCVCPACGGEKFSKIGTDEREVLEYVPSYFKRVLHIRPKMSCRACETIVQAPMPSLPIERGRPGPALLAHVLMSKFGDHQPLHRQAAIYARSGVDIDRSTMAGWVGHMAAVLDPLREGIGRHFRSR